MKKLFKVFLLAIASVVAGTVASAQVTTASLGGRIVDTKGETIIGVAIIATHVPSGTVYGAVTNADGRYTINGLRAGGPYTIEISSLGYQGQVYNDITLQLGEQFTLDARLADDTQQLQSSVVIADASRFRRERNGAATNISARQLNSVPTVSRSMNDIMLLTPQASTTSSGFAVGGGNYRGSSVTVDGAAFNNAFGIGSNLPAGGSPISLDAIEQMSINITPFDVRQSGFQGGAINAVTKSGSNEFHASAYDYYTSEKLRGYDVAGEEVPKSKALNHTIGATVGGPIIKNKLFFFLNGEYTFDTVPGSTSVARTSTSEKWGSDVPGNYPTVAQMDEMKQFLDSKFGYNPGRYQGYSLQTPDYKVLARIDWNINADNRLNVRFSHTHTFGSNPPSSSMSPIGGTNSSFVTPSGEAVSFNRYSAGRQAPSALFYEAARYFQEQNFTSVAAELNSRFGNANNMLRLTWSHQDEPRSYIGSFFPTVDILAKDNASGTDTHAIMTTIGIDPFTYGNLRDVQTLTATEELSFNAGIHNLLAGAQIEWNRATNGYMQGGAGWYIYDSWDAFKNDVNGAGGKATAFMITHANLDDPTKQAFPAFDYTQASLYAQDEMNFSPYFKLTAGLRLEMPIISIPTDNENKDFTAVANANPSSSFNGLKTSDVPAPRLSFSPRVGFNWDVLKDRTLVVRGGTGIYTGRIPNVWLVSAIGNSNVLQYQYIANPRTGNAVVPFNADRSAIINSVYSSGNFKKQELAAPTATTILARDLKMPSSWKSSLAVDFNLPGNFKATLEGIYSTNFNEVYASPLGYKQSGTVQLPGEPAPRNSWISEGIRNKDNGVMNGFYAHNISNLRGSYYSVTAQVSKSFNWGLDLMAAYTNSGAKSVSDGQGDQISEFANTYGLHGSSEPVLGNAYYVAPHRAIASIAYTIAEGSHAATKLSVFYEGYNIGFISSYSYSRVSYLMNNVSGGSGASQLIYIPTADQLKSMPFSSDANKAAFESFIASDKYLSKHRGEYSIRNGAVAPWLNRINARVAQDVYFNLAGKKQTVEISLDVKNVANLLNSDWGLYKQMTSNTILSYKNNEYTFTKPEWKNYNSLLSTWQMLLSARWSF
ncbi:MAG: TonB-dependent receptor [Bacteroidales bacterium]|nr:TonB-dependent receptor [Bacteroidales bacterium]